MNRAPNWGRVETNQMEASLEAGQIWLCLITDISGALGIGLKRVTERDDRGGKGVVLFVCLCVFLCRYVCTFTRKPVERKEEGANQKRE